MMQIQKLRVEQVKGTSDVYDNFGQQILVMAEAWQQQFTPTNGQTVFTLNRHYTVGSNSLQVVVNGSVQNGSDSYEETSSNTVTFSEPLFDTDVVMFRVEGAGSGTTFASDHGHVYREIPEGVKDGVNTYFTLAKGPIAGTECIFLNGILLSPGEDYTMDNIREITFLYPLEADDKLVANYIYALR